MFCIGMFPFIFREYYGHGTEYGLGGVGLGGTGLGTGLGVGLGGVGLGGVGLGGTKTRLPVETSITDLLGTGQSEKIHYEQKMLADFFLSR